MSEGKGVLLFDSREPLISGWLVIGDKHYEIFGQRMNDIRTNLHVKLTGERHGQSSASGERKCDLA